MIGRTGEEEARCTPPLVRTISLGFPDKLLFDPSITRPTGLTITLTTARQGTGWEGELRGRRSGP